MRLSTRTSAYHPGQKLRVLTPAVRARILSTKQRKPRNESTHRSCRKPASGPEHTSFFAPEFLAHCRAERFARPIHGVANLRRRSAGGVTRGHDYRLAFLGVHETRCLQQPRLITWRNGEEPMFIGMDQLPGLNASPKNLDLSAPADRTRVCAARAQTPRQRLESGL